jgi:hypothetical protein
LSLTVHHTLFTDRTSDVEKMKITDRIGLNESLMDTLSTLSESNDLEKPFSSADRAQR